MRAYRRNRRDSHFFWTVSLTFSAVAALMYCLASWQFPGMASWFLLYYIFGALWMPSLMGLGSLSLVMSRRVVWMVACGIAVLGLTGTVFLTLAPMHTESLLQLRGGAGTGVVAERADWLIPLIVMNSFGTVAVIGVALWSAWQAWQHKVDRRFFFGNVWLAGGVLMIAAAGSGARLGLPELFWVIMFAGWLVTFYGYSLLTPRASVASVGAAQRSAMKHGE